ncbi:MAG TPA: PEP/pyruvate-binding domain-containing protein, partial [Polyangiales bacterium]
MNNQTSAVRVESAQAKLVFVRSFAELRKQDVDSVGGKGANLGELTAAKFPVPPGFVITARGYLHAVETAQVRGKLLELAKTIDLDDGASLARCATELRALIEHAGIPSDLREEILGAYRALGRDVEVAVRSSSTSEDAEGTSFAGMNETFTNVIGEQALLDAVLACWKSLWGQRVITYRALQRLGGEPAMAVVVQRMVPSEKSGVMFTRGPSQADAERVVIEAAFGLGEVVVSGQVEPDTYLVDKSSMRVVQTKVGVKTHKLVSAQGSSIKVTLDAREGAAQVLSEQEVLEVAHLGLEVERHYGAPQDTEWAYAGGVLYLLQSRPITTRATTTEAPALGTELLRGLGAAPGVGSGAARILVGPEQGERLREGEVLVAAMTAPDWLPTLRRAAALVTDGGGVTCHAAIVSRELGIPCVVGTRDATKRIRDGERITVDGGAGKV